ADPAAEAKRLLERLEHEPTSIGFLIADTPSLFVSTKPLEDLRERVKKETDELRAIAESLRPKS
ncbi:MAG TPA: hypothetical protein VK477_14560, partial [Acidobacteriota bacterium]|nr:hypothetical protein [Acidobacteriota bacterium]